MATVGFVVPEDADLLRPAIALCRTDQHNCRRHSSHLPFSPSKHHVSGAGSELPQALLRHISVRSSRVRSRGTETLSWQSRNAPQLVQS